MGTTRPTAQMPDLSALRISDSKRGGKPVGKWIGIVIILLLIVAAGLWGASLLKNRAPEVEVAAAISPSSAPASVLLNATGYVTPRRRASVAAKITGKIVAVYVDEGVHVTQGQILAQLDDSDYRTSMISTKADRDSTLALIPDLEVQL
jgi:multidrug efflux pump subunit AcrA (membrane-fusion protein)